MAGLGGVIRSGETLSYWTADGIRLTYSFKRNGVKEDIVLSTSPSEDLALQYLVKLDASLEAKLDAKGNLLVYGPSGVLSGVIQSGDERSAELVIKARQNAPRDRLLYIIPAPVVLDADHNEFSGLAHFSYNAPILTIHNSDLSSLAAPVTIDPSIVITTTPEFLSGNNEGMISFDTDAISRAVQSGGVIGSWSGTSPFNTPRYGHTSVSHNGYLYVIGGFDGTTYLNDVQYAAIAADGTIGAWNTTTPFNTARYRHTSVVYNGYLYVIGGHSGIFESDVQYAAIASDGTVGAWNTTTSFNTGRRFHASVAYRGYLYVLGGESGIGAVNDVQYSPIAANGAVGPWNATTNLYTPLAGPSSVAYNGYLYVIGGFDGSTGLNTSIVQYAPIAPNGSIGTWIATTSCGGARVAHTSVVHNGYLYVIGGSGGGHLNDVQYTPIGQNGTLGRWTATTSFNIGRSNHSSVACNGYLYVIGGGNAGVLGDVQYAPISSSGVVGGWNSTTGFTTARYGHTSVVYNGYVYVIGGGDGTTNFNDVQFAALASDGTVGAWNTTTAFNTARIFHASVAHNGYLYVIGGQGTGFLNDAQYASIAADGSVGTWSFTTSVPAARRGHTSVIYNGYLYVMGGYDGAFRNDVQHAAIASDGTVDGWSASTSFAGTRAYHASVAYGGYLYVIGGGGGTYNDVQYAPIASDGTVGTWSTTASFAGARAYLSSVAYNGYLYVIGGDGPYFNDVQVAPIAANGTVGVWNTTTSFNTGRYGHTSIVCNGYVYLVGGYSSAGSVDDVQYASLAPNGTVSGWNATASFTTGRTGHTAVAYSGYLYVIGGYSGGGPLNDVQYAPLAADGTVGPWNPTAPFDTARSGHTSFVYNGYLYILGGYSSITYLNHVGYAPIASDGTVGPWFTTTAFPTARRFHASVVHNGYAYVIGGTSSSGNLNDVSYAPIAANGTINAWNATTSFDTARAAHASVVYNGYLYLLGGDTGSGYLNDVQYAPIASNGTVGAWNATASFRYGRFRHDAVVYNGSLYVMGGYGGVNVNDIQYAPIVSNGKLGAWNATIPFPIPRNHHRSVAYNGYVYVLGGHDGSGYRNYVHYSSLNGPPARALYSRLVDAGADRTVNSVQFTSSGSGPWGTVNLSVMTAASAGVFGPRTSIANALSGTAYPVNACARYVWASFELDDTSSSTTDSGWALGRKDILDFAITYTPISSTATEPLLGTKTTAVHLTWSALTGASYNVNRCTYSGSPCAPATTIATTGATSWDDSVLEDGSSYWYLVEAFCP